MKNLSQKFNGQWAVIIHSLTYDRACTKAYQLRECGAKVKISMAK